MATAKTVLSSLAFVYIAAACIYIVFTRYVYKLGTPLKDSYTKEQLVIYATEKERRSQVFRIGVLGGLGLLIACRSAGCSF